MNSPERIFLDTNIYIIGTQAPESDEGKILQAIGYNGGENKIITSTIILSPELIDQIRRVAKYLWGKDRSGFVLSRVFKYLNLSYITPNQDWQLQSQQLRQTKQIPLEDIEIFLSAKYGGANCFVSGNRTLIQAIADFECLTAENFVKRYL
ncbi:MAG: hypothetical protein ACK6CG_09400 [Pseudanabaena sp.]